MYHFNVVAGRGGTIETWRSGWVFIITMGPALIQHLEKHMATSLSALDCGDIIYMHTDALHFTACVLQIRILYPAHCPVHITVYFMI